MASKNNIFQTIAVFLIGITLIATLSTTAIAFTAQQTILDGEYVAETLEEDGGYEFITEQMQSGMTPPSSEQPSRETNDQAVAQAEMQQAVITESYVASQAEANIKRFYAFLHGERSDPGLRVDTTPIKKNVGENVEQQIREQEPHELIGDVTQSQYSGVSIDRELVKQLDAGGESYHAAQVEFKTDVRNQVVEQLVEEAILSSSPDELLALVSEDHDPSAYSESEKQAMVNERWDEITVAVEEEIRSERSDEINATVESQLTELEQSVTDSTAADGEMPEGIVEPTRELQLTIIQALIGEISYEKYQADTAAARNELANAASELTQEEMGEMPDEIVITEQLSGKQHEMLGTASTAVQWFDRLVFALPVLAVVLSGGVYFISQSALTTILTTSAASLSSGTLLFGTVQMTRPLVEAEAGTDPAVNFVLIFLDGIYTVLQTFSIGLISVGVLFGFVFIVHRFDLLETIT